mmetsp:Transcript_94873/g.267865  ORF Transcript_94873/g.267865 Transcript_94873/m.267865 type:complete len:438 (+) Transcript_94873:1282-2595(+)
MQTLVPGLQDHPLRRGHAETLARADAEKVVVEAIYLMVGAEASMHRVRLAEYMLPVVRAVGVDVEARKGDVDLCVGARREHAGVGERSRCPPRKARHERPDAESLTSRPRRTTQKAERLALRGDDGREFQHLRAIQHPSQKYHEPALRFVGECHQIVAKDEQLPCHDGQLHLCLHRAIFWVEPQLAATVANEVHHAEPPSAHERDVLLHLAGIGISKVAWRLAADGGQPSEPSRPAIAIEARGLLRQRLEAQYQLAHLAVARGERCLRRNLVGRVDLQRCELAGALSAEIIARELMGWTCKPRQRARLRRCAPEPRLGRRHAHEAPTPVGEEVRHRRCKGWRRLLRWGPGQVEPPSHCWRGCPHAQMGFWHHYPASGERLHKVPRGHWQPLHSMPHGPLETDRPRIWVCHPFALRGLDGRRRQDLNQASSQCPSRLL